jgi:hypothetical protein
LIDYNHLLYIQSVQKKYFQKYDFELVINDEVENFRDYDHPDFMYPYGPRKNLIESFMFKAGNFEIDEMSYRINYLDYDYSKMKFLISSVCLEGSFYESIYEPLPNLYRYLLKLLFKIEDTKPKNDCDGPEFQKLKFSRMNRGVQDFRNSYTHAMMKDKILLEISLELDQFET